VPADVPVVALDARDREDVKQGLITLLTSVLDRVDTGVREVTG
jgi:hypothetical protein